MQDQTSKMIKVTTDLRDISYNKGLTDDITNTRQKVEGIQDRLNNSNRNMGDLARQNDAMAADFKAIGKNLQASTNAVNTNNGLFQRLFKQGFQIHSDDVTKSVSQEFKEITGKSIDGFIKEKIVQELKQYFQQAQKERLSAQHAASAAINATNANVAAFRQLHHYMTYYLIEFAGILLLTTATPGLWKLLTVTATTAVSIIFNSYTQRKDETNDN